MSTYKINNLGKKSIREEIEDSKKSIYIAGPISLIFLITITIMIFRFSPPTLIITSVIFIVVYFLFYQVSFFNRGRIVSKFIISIVLKNDTVLLETNSWFNWPSCLYKANIKAFDLIPTKHDLLDNILKVVFFEKGKRVELILIEKYFDDLPDLFAPNSTLHPIRGTVLKRNNATF